MSNLLLKDKMQAVSNIAENEFIAPMRDEEETSQIARAIKRGLHFLASEQREDGSWTGDYGGPMFLLPMYVSAFYIAQRPIEEETRREAIRYFKNVQNSDGSIGLHVEDEGSMFTSVLSYAALRLLGVSKEEPELLRMRGWILNNGTALGSASWGKFFLALLNLYPYEGLNPVLPELWLMPYAVPFHPGRLWCHCRQVYLPMAWLYGQKAKVAETPLIKEIRREIYDKPYESIDFSAHYDTVAPCDNYNPASLPLKAVNRLMLQFNNLGFKELRNKSLQELYKHILYEDETTNFIDIGPVNSVLNSLVHHFTDPKGEAAEKSFAALKRYFCRAEDGVKMNGYNSTALWDTAFSVQTIFATPFMEEYSETLLKAKEFIVNNQVIEDVPEPDRYRRHISRGGWPFSDREHGWPITDCTAEGLKSYLLLEKSGGPEIPSELIKASVELILSFQNKEGGWATYEKRRGSPLLELLNPSSVFGDIMIDYSYVECTSACIQALTAVKARFAGALLRRIEEAIKRGVAFIRRRQRPDGSWEGSWAVCFTYGTWFGVWGLLAGGVSRNSPEIQRACGFLLEKQNKDGGWGESYRSCKERRYVRHKESQAVNTAWALMALIKAGLAESAAAKRAARFLVNRQLENGDWPKESLVGVFNKTTLINYEYYRRYFPIWALSLYYAEKH